MLISATEAKQVLAKAIDLAKDKKVRTTATVFKANGTIIETQDLKSFEQIRSIVGGHVQITHYEGAEVAVNEEGMMIGLPANMAFAVASDGHAFLGDVVVLHSSLDVSNLPYDHP